MNRRRNPDFNKQQSERIDSRHVLIVIFIVVGWLSAAPVVEWIATTIENFIIWNWSK